VNQTVFPLVPRHRLIGLAFGTIESVRRGRGFDLAGSRPYVPGDPVQAIDWKSSARLATARDTDEFVVLERSAEEAPRVVVVVDRRPEMSLYEPDAPWLCKPAAVESIVQLVEASTRAAHGLLGYIDFASSDDGRGFWRPPRGQVHADELLERVRSAPYDAPQTSLADALARLGELRRDLPAGSFVFLVSDFLAPVPAETWSVALSRRWELVPVIVQDPTWEQDFPAISSVVTPIVGPSQGRVEYVRLSKAEVEARRASNRGRLARLLAECEERALTPVLISSSEREEILRAFLRWHEQRCLERGRVW
jgi:uncharacterized protein (DUF58 family)